MKKQKTSIILFIISFVFLMIYGILLSYNYRMDTNYNLLFDSDTRRVVGDATEIFENHYRLSVHPLFIIFIQPLVFVLKGIVLNKTIAIILLSVLASSLSVVYIYKILSIINKDKRINILLSLIYLFSFSNIIYTSGIEIYNFAVLFLLVLWHYYLTKQKEIYNFYSYILLIVLGVFSAGFTITNIVIFGIILFLLLINKQIKIKNFIAVSFITCIMIVGINVGQRLIWGNTPVIWNTSVSQEKNNYAKLSVKKKNIKNVLLYDYYNPLVSSDIKLKVKYGNSYNIDNYILVFKDMNIFHFILLSSFYIFLILLIFRNFKKNKITNTGLLLALVFNTTLHLIYGNNSTFLYSLHFIYLIILLFGINISTEDNKKLKIISRFYLLVFLLIELINNNLIFIKVLKYVDEVINKNYIFAFLGNTKTIIVEVIVIVAIIFIIYYLPIIYNKIKKEMVKEKKYSYVLILIILIAIIQMIFIKQESFSQEIVKEKGENFGKTITQHSDYYLSEDFKTYYKRELNALKSYEYEVWKLKNEYQTKPTAKVDWSRFYYFGMAGRKKILFKDDELIDIESKETLYTFDVDDVVIVPNEYSVLLKTNQKDFIKIYEDNSGIHINKNGKDEIIKGTDVSIELYSFNDYKYKNILKTIYGELLFNIKDSVIYPNIIVYDKPWYRDAAMASMVLKRTNNTDLIREWVLQIDELYDKQNKGVSEPDNLGELLFIISTQEERNEELINRIEEEAYRIAKANDKGYYIYGQTDFGEMYLYQNLWYKLGIESVGREFNFDLDSIPKDGYSKMAWWSDYFIEDASYEVSLDYPYLTYAMRHKIERGPIPINDSLYPMSIEINASEANYDNYKGIDNTMINMHASPLHTWSAAELMLLLMDNN